MPEGSREFLPGIGDYNEFRHQLEDEKEAKEIEKRGEHEKAFGDETDPEDEDPEYQDD